MQSRIPSISLPITKKDEEKDGKTKMEIIVERYKDKLSTLPNHKSWINHDLYKYEGFWHHRGFWFHSTASFSLEIVMALQDDFQAQQTDVLLASHPKSGTTWIKALAFAIVNRTKFSDNNGSDSVHPLLTTNPHDCVPFIETETFLNNPCYPNGLISTHIPYSMLPKTIVSSNCRIVYISRNPKDVLISFWHFMNKWLLSRDDLSPPIKLEDAFELFSKGFSQYGPCWDHVIGYRKASLERPDNVLFLSYEQMKKDTRNEVKKLAKFIGYPFNEEEEARGEVEEIVKLCSLKMLSEMNKANKAGKEITKLTSDGLFFRKGTVNDSVNYLTPEMIQILDKITEEKYNGLDISF